MREQSQQHNNDATVTRPHRVWKRLLAILVSIVFLQMIVLSPSSYSDNSTLVWIRATLLGTGGSITLGDVLTKPTNNDSSMAAHTRGVSSLELKENSTESASSPNTGKFDSAGIASLAMNDARSTVAANLSSNALNKTIVKKRYSGGSASKFRSEAKARAQAAASQKLNETSVQSDVFTSTQHTSVEGISLGVNISKATMTQGSSTKSANIVEESRESPNAITIDIMSVGSQNRSHYQTAQRKTWASHSSVRSFYPITELDDKDPQCGSKTSLEQVGVMVEQCRHWFLEGFLKQYQYLPRSWVIRKANPAGWMCAQSRWGNGMAKLAKLYRNGVANGTAALPDFFIVVDDDTLMRIDMFVETMEHVNPKVPMVWAGCVGIIPKGEGMYRFTPTGGDGMIFSRAAMERFIRPLHCPNSTTSTPRNADVAGRAHTDDDDVMATCARLKENLIREDLDWKDGMSLVDLFAAISNRNPNCFISDQLLGHFINYYYLSERWTTEPYFSDYQYSRMHPYPNNSALVMDEAANDPIPLSRKYTCLGAEAKKDCTATSPWCHYMDAKAMLRDARLSKKLSSS